MKHFFLCLLVLCAFSSFAQTATEKLPGFYSTETPAYKQHQILLNQAKYAPRPKQKTTLGSGTVYDTTRWNLLVDSTWGFGWTTAQKLAVFNNWWDTVSNNYPCFVHLPAYNWDSITTALRAEISADVSEGRFAAIINYLLSLVNDGHTNFYDYIVNYPNSIYPGLPLLRGESGEFGACITTWNDTQALVYDVYPEHPLGLEPGDIILGYNGYPWTQLLQTIFRYQLPNSVYKGSTDSATMHRYIQAAGENWYLFDTINILKCNGTRVNLPTSLMEGTFYAAFCTEQMAQPGIYKPNYSDYYNDNMDVSFGKLHGTNIGYVYMYDCEDTTNKLLHAFQTLINDSMVDGLILDIRTNFGGGFNAYWQAYQFLAAAGTSWVGYGQRVNHTDRTAMYIDGPTSWYDIYDMDPSYFNHPVAILCGPNAVSAGDFLPVMFKHDPHVKLFGKPTAGAFGNLMSFGVGNGYFSATMQQTNFFQAADTGNYISHTEFPVDVYNWFNKDSVCAGKDNVVSGAVQWINGLLAAPDLAGKHVSISAYPNPASDLISISLTNLAAQPVQIALYDLMGRTIQTRHYTPTTDKAIQILDVSAMQAGTYLLKVSTGAQQFTQLETKM